MSRTTNGPGLGGPMTVRTAILLAALGVVVFLTFSVFFRFLLTFAIAAPVALLLSPTYERLAAFMRRKRGAAAMVMVLWTLSLVAIPLAITLTLLGSQALGFFSWLGPQLEPERLQMFFRETLPARIPWFAAAWALVEPYLAPIASTLLTQISAGVNILIQRVATGVGSMAMEMFFFFLFLFFLLRDGPSLIALLRSLSPLSPRQEAHVIGHVAATVKGSLLGVLLVPLAQGGLATLGYWMFGLPNALLWGGITAIASLIPLLGAPIIWVPITLYLLFTGATWKGVALFAYGTVVVSGIDNVIKPLLLSGAARIHPLLGFLAVVGGTLAFGPAGLLVGPIVLSLAMSALRIYQTEFRGEDAGPAVIE